ncbi:dihydroorotate dehydrogenase [Streptomyces sp. NPDC001941]|uniref:dihydroorotate dehydrogenase n=1 Tax=Streptomyces sp. NPDC001941 TaxID=3154659 RepID=UPI00331C8809
MTTPTTPPTPTTPSASTTGAPDLTARFGHHRLPNPVTTASGCAGYGREIARFLPLDALGALITKTVMPYPRSGRPTPRMAETPSGMLNGIGLQGSGIDAFVAHELPWLYEQGARTVVSIAGRDAGEYAQCAARLRGLPGVVGIEVNISCPNVADRGAVFACNADASHAVVAAVREAADPAHPVYAKLSPDVTSVTDVAAACVAAGADGLSLINTLLGVVVDTDTLRPALSGTTGGLSGPAIRPVAVRCVYQVYAAMRAGAFREVPICGTGGIRSGLDALEFLAAGASTVSVGTAVFNDPGAPVRIVRELEQILTDRHIPSVEAVVGAAHRGGALVRQG